MHVDVGPLPSSSVRAWIGYARTVLAEAQGGNGPAAATLAPDVVEAFDAYLDEWSGLAERSSTFRWSTDVDVELAEYLLHSFFRIAERLAQAAGARGATVAPPEGDAFYTALVTALLDALDGEGRSTSEFSDHLRTFWPGLQRRR